MTITADGANGLGSRIRELRTERGLTQGQVADLLGVAKSAVSRVESGNRGLAAAELAVLAEHLDVPADFILFGERDGEVLLRAEGDAEEAVAAARGVIEDIEFVEALLE